MNIIRRLIYRIRALRIDRLRADMIATGETIQRLEARQLAALNVWARKGKMAARLRQPVPHFLRRGAR